MRLRNTLAALTVGLVGHAHAMSGNQFMEAARIDGESGISLLAYVAGIGAMNDVNRVYQTSVVTFCMPSGADYKQAVAISLSALRQQPSDWHKPSVGVILPALARAWPCPSQ